VLRLLRPKRGNKEGVMSQEDMKELRATEAKVTDRGIVAEKLDAVGWGLFFVWIGLALLFDFGWGATLIG